MKSYTVHINNMENWFVQSAVRSSCKEQWLVISCCTSDAMRGVGRICGGHPQSSPQLLVKDGIVQLPGGRPVVAVGSGLIMPSLSVLKTWHASQEKQF